jgi:hypothetical protein
MLNEAVFHKGIALLMAAYPDYECSSATVDVYRERLCRLTDQEFEAAVYRHIDTCKWFPKISELLGAVQSLLPSPIDVWTQLIAAAEAGEQPEMDGATKKAMDFIGGWEQFSITSYDDLRFIFKAFREAYLEAQDRETGAQAQISTRTVPQLEG